jgi:hypothetical protein
MEPSLPKTISKNPLRLWTDGPARLSKRFREEEAKSRSARANDSLDILVGSMTKRHSTFLSCLSSPGSAAFGEIQHRNEHS